MPVHDQGHFACTTLSSWTPTISPETPEPKDKEQNKQDNKDCEKNTNATADTAAEAAISIAWWATAISAANA